jgi:small nuclear ribonucleoprotein (snRNP)-like protein
MSDAIEPRQSAPLPAEGAALSRAADPLADDWSEGLRGPVRALGIPEPKRLQPDEIAPAAPQEPAAPAAPVAEVEAPDAWGTSEDPLHSEPPASTDFRDTPPSPAPAFIAETPPPPPSLEAAAPALPSFEADKTPPSAAPAFVAELPPAAPTLIAEVLQAPPPFVAEAPVAPPPFVLEPPPAPVLPPAAPSFEADKTPPLPTRAPPSAEESEAVAAGEASPADDGWATPAVAEPAASLAQPPPEESAISWIAPAATPAAQAVPVVDAPAAATPSAEAPPVWTAPAPPPRAEAPPAWTAPAAAPAGEPATPWSEPVAAPPSVPGVDPWTAATPAADPWTATAITAENEASAWGAAAAMQAAPISAPEAAPAPPAADAWAMPPPADASAPAADQWGAPPAPAADPWSATPAAPVAAEEWKAEAPSDEWQEIKRERPPDLGATQAADWSTLSKGPDWAAPAHTDAAPSEDSWGAPPPALTNSAWDAPPAPAPVPAQWGAPPAAETEWSPPPPPPADLPSWTPPSATAVLEEFEPIEPVPGAAKDLFGSVPTGGSLAGDDDLTAGQTPAGEEKPVELSDDDADLLVPIDEDPPAPKAQTLAQLSPVSLSPLEVAGEYRVAVHTRGGRTVRGSVKDIDLAKSSFLLTPQGGGDYETVYHSDVKAIFFMLAPNEKAKQGEGKKVRVTFTDGRTVEGHRDGGEAKHGFFIVPLDAQRTNTRKIYIAREATSDVKGI